MDKTTKMLQAIINGQSALKQELLHEIKKSKEQIVKEFDDKINSKIDGLDKKLTKRLDKIGKQLAYLEDDTPTRDEYDGLEKRVGKLEKKILLNV